MNFSELIRTKTFYVGLTTILGGVAAYATGEANLVTAGVTILGGVYAICRRDTDATTQKMIATQQSNVLGLVPSEPPQQ